MRVKHVFAPEVVTDPMEALRREVYGRGALEACAEAIGKSHQTVSKKLHEEEGNCFSLRQAMAIEQFLETDALAECFAARRGGVFIRLPKVPASAASGVSGLVALYSELVQAFSESSAAFSTSLKDGNVDLAEVERVHKELRDVYTCGEQLVAAAKVIAEKKP